jgi:transposase
LRAQLGVRDAFATAFVFAVRRLGKAPVADVSEVIAAGLHVPTGIGADECGRGALLVAVEPDLELVRDLVRRGDVRERQAVLRVLAALPDPAQFTDIAVDACRTNVDGVFRAIACDNAFPAAQLADAAFAQLVLKALFTGAPLARVVGLAARTTPELVRMVEAYASERRAAGRPVPEDAKLVTGT